MKCNWDEYFFLIARTVAMRAKCLRAQIGAVAVLDKRIITTGYNGPPSGVTHCDLRGGCWRDLNSVPSGGARGECPSVHAEMNLITQAALHGVSLKGSTVYCEKQPCPTCAGLLINSGVAKIIYLQPYPDKLCFTLCHEGGVDISQYTMRGELYNAIGTGSRAYQKAFKGHETGNENPVNEGSPLLS